MNGFLTDAIFISLYVCQFKNKMFGMCRITVFLGCLGMLWNNLRVAGYFCVFLIVKVLFAAEAKLSVLISPVHVRKHCRCQLTMAMLAYMGMADQKHKVLFTKKEP